MLYFLNVLLESNGMQLEFTDFEIDVFNNSLKNNIGWSHKNQEGSGWGTHVYLWRIHFDIWQN